MKNFKSLLVLTLLIFSITIFRYNNYKERDHTNPFPISWDVFGYYLYLPATFIYHDLGLENAEWQKNIREKYKPSTTDYQVTNGEGNKKVIIYNIGYAFINAPGFFIANACAADAEKDGFTRPYQLAMQITAFLLTLIGLYLFRNILLYFFSDTISALLLFLITVGTNYFFQVVYDATMPHNILFTLNCFIIWFTIKWYDTKKTKHLFFLATSLGLATICRPTELIWILVPVLWGVFDKQSAIEKWGFIKSHFSQIILFATTLTAIIFIQLIYLKFATGSFISINYHSERFAFFDPYTWKFLFSYRKGWLLYTPIMIFAILGFYFFRKYNRNNWIAFASFFIINLYVVSSWECWWYGASFSQRPMIETYVAMSLPLGYFLVWLKDKALLIKATMGVLLTALVFLNGFQSWQYLNGILENEHMTKEYYWRIFAKTSVNPDDKQYLCVDRGIPFSDYPDHLDKYELSQPFFVDYEIPQEGIPDKNIVDTTAHQGKKSFVLKDEVQFTKAFEKKYEDLTDKSYVWIRGSVWVYLTAPYTESNSCLVITSENNGKAIKYLTTNYNDFNIPLHQWTEIHLNYMTPEIRHSDDVVKAYFWNMGSKPVLIDNFKIEVFQPKFDPR